MLLLRYSSSSNSEVFASLNAVAYNHAMETIILENQLLYIETLYRIVCDSEEPETIRQALAALTRTEEGRAYLAMNPIQV